MSYDNSKKTPAVALGYANKPAGGCVFLMQRQVFIRANEGIKEAIEIVFDFNTLYYKKSLKQCPCDAQDIIMLQLTVSSSTSHLPLQLLLIFTGSYQQSYSLSSSLC